MYLFASHISWAAMELFNLSIYVAWGNCESWGLNIILTFMAVMHPPDMGMTIQEFLRLTDWAVIRYIQGRICGNGYYPHPRTCSFDGFVASSDSLNILLWNLETTVQVSRKVSSWPWNLLWFGEWHVYHDLHKPYWTSKQDILTTVRVKICSKENKSFYQHLHIMNQCCGC